MKLLLVLFVAVVVYLSGMHFLVKEYKACTSKQEKTQAQSVPMMMAATILFLVFCIHTTSLSLQGVLPLI